MGSKFKGHKARSIAEQGCIAFLLGWLITIIAFGLLLNSWLF